MIFGEKLSEIRNFKKDSLRKLGEKTGFSHAYIKQIESGDSPVSLKFLEKIIEVYPEEREILELAYCEEKLPVSVFEKLKTNQKVDSVIERISEGNSFEELYPVLFKELDTEGQKEIMNLIVNRLEKLSDEGKYKKDIIKLEKMKKLIKEI